MPGEVAIQSIEVRAAKLGAGVLFGVGAGLQIRFEGSQVIRARSELQFDLGSDDRLLRPTKPVGSPSRSRRQYRFRLRPSQFGDSPRQARGPSQAQSAMKRSILR
jgi:hypothetical protein